MMGDWVHCNHCFHQPGDGRGFYLTSCGHIFCEQCRKKATESKCEMCSAKCTTLPLTSKMKPEVDIFFTDPCEIARKHTKELNQVIEFQKNHRLRLMAYNKQKMNRQIKQQRDLEREIVVVKEKNSYYERLIQNQGGGGVMNIRVSPQQRPSSAGSRSSPRGMQPIQGQGYVSHQPISSLSPQQLQQLAASKRKLQGTTVPSDPNDWKSPPPNQQDASISSSQHSTARNTPTGSKITSNRMLARTPPAHGKMGTIPGSTPSPQGEEKRKIGLSATSVGAYGDGGKMEVSPSGSLTSGVQTRVPTSAASFAAPRTSSQQLGLGLLQQQQRNPPRPIQISSMTSPPEPSSRDRGPVLVVPSPGGRSYREYPLSGLSAGHFKSPP